MFLECGFIAYYFYGVIFVIGLVFGSFINCMALRMVTHESFLKGRSHCAKCGHQLSIADLVPVFSYLFLKGKCRYCNAKISPRYMLVEMITGCAFFLIVFKYGISWMTLRNLIFVCILLGLSLVDFDTYEIPDGFIVLGIINWIAFLPLITGRIGPEYLSSNVSFIPFVKDGILGGFIISGALLLLSMLFDKITGKESLGGGDIKLFFLVGLYLGLLESLFCLILACVLGIVFSLVVKNNRIPFGPAISSATFLTLMIGDKVVEWYIHLFL